MDEIVVDEQPIISLEGVSKSFVNNLVINSCTLKLYPNHVYGLVGKSGAGKSTLLRLMMGIYQPSSGSCSLFGEALPKLSDQTLNRIGYIHQEDELIGWFSGLEFLNFIRSHYLNWNDELASTLLESFEVPIRQRINLLSPGERQCLALVAALAHEPDLLILDEPASALDPLRREQFIKAILEFMSIEGRTVLISSHLLSDLDRLIDQLLVVNSGEIICNTSLDEAKASFTRIVLWGAESQIRSLGIDSEILSLHVSGSTASAIVSRKGAAAIRAKAHSQGWSIEEGALTLEEAFSYLVSAPPGGATANKLNRWGGAGHDQ